MTASLDGATARGLGKTLRRTFEDDSAADLAFGAALRIANARGLHETGQATPRARVIASLLPDLPYADWGGALLGVTYEARLGAGERRRSGVHYTPQSVAEFLLSRTDDRGLLVDPACGAGRFLLTAAKRRGGDPALPGLHGLRGFELDPIAAALAAEALALDAHGGDIATARAFWTARITVGDALREARGSADAVVGNPPYFAALGHDGLQAVAKERFPRVYSGRNDVSHFFVALALELLGDGGRFALVLPAYFRDNTFASKLRDVLAAETRDLTLYDPATTHLFDAQVHTVLLTGTKQKGVRSPGAALLGERGPIFAPRVFVPLPGVGTKVLLADLGHAARTGAAPVTLRAAPEEPTALLDKMAAHTPLARLADVEKGCETGRNQVFSLDRAKVVALGLEAELLYPLLKGRDVLPFVLRRSDAVLLYLDGRTPLEDYPRAAAYLAPFKDELLKRADCRDGVYPWWRLHRPRTRALADAPKKLVAPYRTKTPVFAVDEEHHLNDGGDVRFIIPNADVDAYFLSGILNSACVRTWLEFRGKKKGALHELFKEPLAKIPIPSPRDALAGAIAASAKVLSRRPPNPEEVTALRAELDRLVAAAYGF